MDYRDPDWVAEKLGLEKNTVYKFLQEGVIPAVQLGRKWLISENQLEQWLAEEAAKQTQGRREAALSALRTVRRMDNFTPEAQEVIRLAHSEARRYGHAYLGQEHLLLGFAGHPESPAGQILGVLGLKPEDLRGEFETCVFSGDANPPPRRLGRTPQAKKAMRLAAREAARTGSALVDSVHLLLGILQAGEGVAYAILTEKGVSEEAVRKAMVKQQGDEHVK